MRVINVLRVPYIALLMLALVVLAAAYQTRAPIALEMASIDEDIYLADGFYLPEETAGVTYRWSNGNAHIQLFGLGSGVGFHLRFNLQQIRPAPLSPSPVTLTLNGREVTRFTPGVDLAAYDFDLPVDAIDARGDAVLDVYSDTFSPKQTIGSNDERMLGLLIDRIQIEFGSGFITPPVLVWLWLVISVLSLYGLARATGLSKRIAFSTGLLLLIAETLGVVFARPWTAYNSPWLAGSVLSVYAVVLRVKRVKRVKKGSQQALGSWQSVVSGPQTAIDNRQLAVRIPHSAFISLLSVFLIWRIALVVIPIVGAGVVGVPECCPQVDPEPLTSWSQAVYGHWYRWDAIWYGTIAQGGYQYFGTREASNVAFFPLFPLIEGLVSRVTGLPVEASGPWVSTLLAFAACLLLYRLAQRETDDAETASRSVVYLLAFPAAYYLAAGFSEATYLLCVLAAFWWARDGRWAWSGVAAFLAGLARLHGALLIVPLGYEYLRQRGFRLRSIRADVLAILGAPLGVLAFMAYLGLQFGRSFAYFEIQSLFFKGSRAEAFPTFPTTTLAKYLDGLLNGAPTTEGVIVVAATILLLILTLEVWLRLPRVYGVYMLTVALFSLVGGDLISMPRFVVPMFPGFIALALLGKRPWVDRIILIVSIALLGVLALMFTKGYWIA